MLKISLFLYLTVAFTYLWLFLWRYRYKTDILLLKLFLSLFIIFLIEGKLNIMLWLDLFHCYLLKLFACTEFSTCFSSALKHEWILLSFIDVIDRILYLILIDLFFIYLLVNKRLWVTFYGYIFSWACINWILSRYELLNNQTK